MRCSSVTTISLLLTISFLHFWLDIIICSKNLILVVFQVYFLSLHVKCRHPIKPSSRMEELWLLIFLLLVVSSWHFLLLQVEFECIQISWYGVYGFLILFLWCSIFIDRVRSSSYRVMLCILVGNCDNSFVILILVIWNSLIKLVETFRCFMSNISLDSDFIHSSQKVGLIHVGVRVRISRLEIYVLVIEFPLFIVQLTAYSLHVDDSVDLFGS